MAKGELDLADPSFLDTEEQTAAREAQLSRDLEFAQLHMVFVNDARAAQLLKFWKENVVNRRVPIGSPIDAYAAAEAVRGFVNVIERQIAFAQTGRPTI